MRAVATTITCGSLILLALLAVPRAGQQRPAAASDGDWPSFRHDPPGTGASRLTQINTSNVAGLRQVWSYSLQPDAPATGRGATGPNSEATPIVVNGTLYVTAANRVVALDPQSGQERWRAVIAGAAPSRRGVAFWPGNGSLPARIFVAAGRRLIALNAASGVVESQFGANGEVDMVVPYNSVPLVYQNILVVGANSPPGAIGGIGNPRAYDARTGAKVWEFNAVAQPGDVGHDTWEGDSWKNRLGANAWPFYFTLDEQRGLLYVPLASPIVPFYGGDRKGANLYGNAVVAVDIQTGKYRWHFQTIHHDLWDADPPAPPGLFDITQNGRTVPVLALTTKSGYVYILNRETGRPIFGVEERAVPKSDVPGELAFPTQPFPVKPPPLARVSFQASDLATAAETSEEHVRACQELIQRNGAATSSSPFTPWAYRADGSPMKSTLVFPGGLGGHNWGGTAYDRQNGLIIAATQDVGALGWVEKSKAGSPVPYDKASLDRTFDVRMNGVPWPCQKPPWGRLTAVNASTGEVAWQRPLGVTDQLPEGKQNTGRPIVAGPIVTAGGLIFIGGTDDNRFRALDAKTGRELWTTKLERRGNADPITYADRAGKQYVAIVATDTLLVYALP